MIILEKNTLLDTFLLKHSKCIYFMDCKIRAFTKLLLPLPLVLIPAWTTDIWRVPGTVGACSQSAFAWDGPKAGSLCSHVSSLVPRTSPCSQQQISWDKMFRKQCRTTPCKKTVSYCSTSSLLIYCGTKIPYCQNTLELFSCKSYCY